MHCLSLPKGCTQFSLTLCRQATTASGSHPHASDLYPFPKHRHPTPLEIFHLPAGASTLEIKSRYYDLVRYHHPDSPIARTHTPCQIERNSHFQSILAAYNTLRYPNASHSHKGVPPYWYGHGSGFDPYMAELSRRRRASHHADYTKRKRDEYETEKRRCEEEEFDRMSRGPKERWMMGFGVVALTVGLFPGLFMFPSRMEDGHRDAVRNLKKARREARGEIGDVRREEMRKRARARELKSNGRVEED